MALWKFFHYITEDDHDLIQEWYAIQDPKVQAQFDATVLLLGGISDWEDVDVTDHFKPLVDKHRGLGEIRFYIDERELGAKKDRRRRFRPVGVWPTRNTGEFVIILGCEKKRMTYIPPGAFDTALKHKGRLEEGKGTIREQT
jgi:hypothetical protein